MCLQWQIFRRRPLTLSLALDWVLKLLLSTGKLSRPRVYSSQTRPLARVKGLSGWPVLATVPEGGRPVLPGLKAGTGEAD